MAYPPSQRSPQFDWPLDGWKIGVALLLFVGLAVWWWMGIDAPVSEESSLPLPLTTSQAYSFGSNSQRTSQDAQNPMISEPSLALTVIALVSIVAATPTLEAAASIPYDLGAPTGEGSATVTSTPAALAVATPVVTDDQPSTVAPSPLPTATPISTATATPASTPGMTPSALTVEVLGSGDAPIANSRPTLSGRATPGAILVVDVEDKRYLIEADATGEWIFVSPAPLPAGTTDLRIGFLGPGGRGEREVQSYPLQIAEDAQPIAPPTLDPLPDEELAAIPALTGRAPVGMTIHVFSRSLAADEPILLAEVVTDEDGRWSAQPEAGLASGDYSVWAVLLDADGRPLSRSAAQRMTIGESQL